MTAAPVVIETLTVRIAALKAVAERIVTLELESADGSELPAWSPGSHVDVHLGEGLIRQYSLSTSPGSGRWRLGVLEELQSRGGSTFVHQSLEVGDTISVTRPRNTFPFELGERPVILVAGGIGITPVLSMAAEAAARQHDWTLLYLSRSPESTAFVDELAGYGDRVRHHFDSVDGIIDLATVLDALDGPNSDIYACGPTGLLDALATYAEAHPTTHLTVERFAADGDVGPRTDDHSFIAELSDGTEVAVAADETLLEALTRAGIPILSSCQEGICGTCETAVLDGVPDHRDQVLSQEERDSGEMMMPCVSRCVGARICLDL